MIRASAPGKLILAGEHAAVYGRPALVAAIGARTHVEVGATPGDRVLLNLPDVGCEASVSWDEILHYGLRARRAWEAYDDDPGPQRLADLSTGDPAHVVKVALAETAEELGVPATGLQIRVESELPVGAGFGSSASVAVAAIGACSMHLAGEVEPARVGRLALEVERRQHGRPSGADHTTVLHGGVQFFEPRASAGLARRTLAFDRHMIRRLAVFHTGLPGNGTGAVVEAVRQKFAGQPAELETLLATMEADTRDLRAALASGTEGPRGLGELVRSYEGSLERLGVVPQAVREAIRAVESLGGAAKVSGAGALSGEAAGALLAYSAGEETTLEPLSSYRRLDVELGVPGLELQLTDEDPEG